MGSDVTPFGEQFVSVEDSMGLVHMSKGVLPPPKHAQSEVSIVCDLATIRSHDRDVVDVVSEMAGVERRATGYRLIACPTPVGCVAGYFPELNVLLPLDHHGHNAQTPAAKAIPIRLLRFTDD